MQRMQAALDAAKAESADHDPDTAPIPRIGAEAAASPDGQTPAGNSTTAAGGISGVGVQVKQSHAGKPKRSARRSGDAAPVGNVSDHRSSRLRRTALATGTALSKSAGKTLPPAEPEPIELPMRTVPTPAREIRPSEAVEAAAPTQPVALRKPPAEPGPTPLPKRVPSEPETEPAIGSERAEGLVPDAPSRPAAKPEPTALYRRSPVTTSPLQAEPATPKRTAVDRTAVDRTDAPPPPIVPSDPAARAGSTVQPEPPKAPASARESAMNAPPRQRARPVGNGHRRHFATDVVAAAVLLIAGAGVLTWVMSTAPHTGTGPKLTPLQRQTAANSAHAAAWVKTQVSPGTAIACDKQMCSALASSGIPAPYLHVLGPTSPPPLDTALIIETLAVRSLFGTSLDTRVAPAVLTTIGAGQAKIAIRTIAPNGVPAFQRALRAGQKVRRRNESVLLNLNRISTSAAARKAIADGDADMRLIVAITDLSAAHPVDIVDFGSVATSASGDLPLRYADLAEPARASRRDDCEFVGEGASLTLTVPTSQLRRRLMADPGPGPSSLLRANVQRRGCIGHRR
jgi:hypothetical protein